MYTAMRRRRLNRLAKILSNTTPWEFDMSTWGEHTGDHKPEEHNYCGTTACALGSAALDPEFQRRGLVGRWFKVGRTWEGQTRWHLGINRAKEGWQILREGRKFFGLSTEEAQDVFTDVTRSRREVISCLRRLAQKPYHKAYEKA